MSFFINHTRLLFFIVVLSAFVRVYDLDKVPNSISADEAAFGYNANSILKTGRDEFGHLLPLYLQSFDDNKNPVFAYVQIPFIGLWGLTDWAIRFPSSLSGVGVVILSFYVTRELTRKTKFSLLVSTFIAICPWLIQYSRVAIEMELALFLTLVAFFLFLKGLASPKLLILSAFVWGVAFYTYHSSKLFSLTFGVVLFILYFRRLLNRYAAVGIMVFLAMLIPYFLMLKGAQVALRPYVVSVFSNQEDYFTSARLSAQDQELGYFEGKLIHNRRFIPLNQAIDGYLSILSPSILYGQNYYNHAPYTRLVYVWMIPLLVIGIYGLTQNKSLFVLLSAWFFLGLLPGGLSKFPPFDRRILLSSFPLIFLAAQGYEQLTRYQKQPPLIYTCMKLALVFIPALSFYFYLHYYFVHGRITVIDTWGNGSREVVNAVHGLKNSYTQVIVSLKLNQPLTFFLYYEKYPPEKYLSEGGTISGGYLDERNQYDKYRFKFIKTEDLKADNLFVWKVDETQPCLSPISTINTSDGKPFTHIGIYDPKLPTCISNTQAGS